VALLGSFFSGKLKRRARCPNINDVRGDTIGRCNTLNSAGLASLVPSGGEMPPGELENNTMAPQRECLKQDGQANCAPLDVTSKQMESC